MKTFREAEYSAKLKRASEQRNRKFNDIMYKENDWVFYQDRNRKAWNGPVRVFCHRGRDVFVWANGDLKKVASCKVQPYVVHESEKDVAEDETSAPTDVHDEPENVDDADVGPKTRSKSLHEKKTDAVGAYWMAASRNECFDDAVTTYVVELPVKYHKIAEVVEAKEKEVKNLEFFGTFEEVDDVGQKTVGSTFLGL